MKIRNHYEKIRPVLSGKSKTIQNEIIDCISECINELVRDEITSAPFFSVQV